MRQTINQKFFKTVLQYNQDNTERIENICAPLKELFGITSFAYCRIFNEGRYILISNCPIYKKMALYYDYVLNTKFFRTQPPYFSIYELYKIIWPENTEDEFIEGLYNEGICHNFNLLRENGGTCEYYFFGASKDFPLLKDFYVSHTHVLEDFITYFHRVGRDLIESSDVTRQGTFPYVRDTYPQIKNVFERTTPWEKKIDEFNALLNSKIQEEIYETAKRNSLTPRELQCLAPLSTGKTAKEIARILNIGPRTVETHINNIRLKTGCQNKSELVIWFEDIFKNYLIKPRSNQLIL